MSWDESRHLYASFLTSIATYLFVNVSFQVRTILISNFDVTDMKRVNDFLDSFTLVPRSGRQRKNTKMRILLHQVTHYLSIGIVTGSLMSFV